MNLTRLTSVFGLALIAVAAAVAIGSASAPAAPTSEVPADEHLAFLAGYWVAESPDGSVIEEHWFEPVDGSITGMLRWRNGANEIGLLEILTINIEEDDGVFRWRHFDRYLNPWESEKEVPSIVRIESFEGNKLVMVRHDEGSPQTPDKMTYDGSTPGKLVVTIESEGEAPLVITLDRQ